MTKSRPVLFWICMVLALTAGLLVYPANVSAQQDAELEEFPFLTTFIPNIQFAPIYVAAGKGYFAAAGLTPAIEYLDEPLVVDLVATNPRAVGIVSGEQVIVSRAQADRPVVYVYAWWQQYPVGIVVAENSDIQSISDLAGRRVGIPGRFGASYSGLTTLLMANDMTEADIQLEAIGFNAPEVFCAGAVEAAVVYLNNEPLQIASRAAAGDCGDVTGVRVFPVSAVANLISNGLIANSAAINDDPDFVQEIVLAYDQALRDVINNPARAYLLSVPFVETLPFDASIEVALTAAAEAQEAFLLTAPDRAAIAASRAEMRLALTELLPPDALLQFDVLLASIELWDADQPGFSDPQAWSAMQDTLLALEVLPQAIDLTPLYTNEFVPASEQGG